MKKTISVICLMLSTVAYASECQDGKKLFSEWKKETKVYQIAEQHELVENSATCILGMHSASKPVKEKKVLNYFTKRLETAKINNEEDAREFVISLIENASKVLPISFMFSTEKEILIRTHVTKKIKGESRDIHIIYHLSNGIFNVHGIRI